MEQEEKKILRNNIIKFVIGIILLGFSFGYMANHPAEKDSILSWFEVLWQRMVVYIHKITDTNSEAVQKKYDYEKTYQELLIMWKNTPCVDANIMTELNEEYLALKKEPVTSLELTLPGYMRKASEFKHMIKTCTSK